MAKPEQGSHDPLKYVTQKQLLYQMIQQQNKQNELLAQMLELLEKMKEMISYGVHW